MLKFDYRDMIGGGLLVGGGAAIAIYSATNYNLGALQRMGPGMFPMALGVILAIFGVVLVIQSFLREGEVPDIRFWSPLFVLGGCAGFALTIGPFGLLPAIVVCAVVTSLADLKLRPVSLVLLCAGLSLLAFLVFRVGLSLPVALYRWPF